MEIQYITKPLSEIEAELELVLVVGKNFEHPFVKNYKKTLEVLGFSGNQDETALLIESKKLFVGCDTLKGKDIRSAIASAIRSILDKDIASVKLATYTNYNKCTASIKALAEGLALGSYSFTIYKSQPKEPKLQTIYISNESYNDKNIEESKIKDAITRALNIAQAVNFVRDIVNTPPDDFYPKIMAKTAKELAKENNLECEILKEEEIKEEKMNALLAVARASRHEPRVIHLSYKPKNPKAVVSIIGKGLTYDSGGLSLKPSNFMLTMKLDKSGGAAVLGILQAVSALGLDIEVHGFIGAVENMIGGNAYKPDDVLTAKNGKTIEVKNTDAEGRLVLADVLCYAQEKVKADVIIDIATLTGACVVGLGEYTFGVMGKNEDLIDKMLHAANISAGEDAAYLPMNRHLKKGLKSTIADISNVSSSRYGGAITAAMFLEEFIKEENKEKWLHLDIAGPAFNESAWGENPAGGSGVSVRSVVSFLQKLQDNKH